MRIQELDTPAVVCDLDLLERNIRDMHARCRQVDIPLRSHTKSSKIPEIAQMQIDAGSVGICCQKVGEAEVMVAGGLRDILLPYNIVGPAKADRLLRLARRGAVITVAVDSVATAQGISDTARQMGGRVRTLIEMDTGGRRCGVQSPAAARDLARQIVGLPGIELRGIMTYPTRVEAAPVLEEAVALFHRDGLPIEEISLGGTGVEALSKQLGGTEHRAGSYLWEGLDRIRTSADLSNERCPLRIICTVVSTPAPGRIIIDGGMKTFCSYPPTPYGHCVGHPELTIYGMSVEHGHVDTTASPHQFRVGDRLTWIPLHQEMALNLHDELVGYRGEQVEVIWPVAGRGKVR
ncbi:MAG: alanine racemase [Caldilineaceae bacterium]|nr:alanine racemase [Caldilineaceae bacterium]